MVKSVSHRITAISMVLLMLLSSTGFAIDVHYCQDKVKSVSVFGKAKSCHEKQETPPCHQKKQSSHNQDDYISQAEKYNCCHNETVVIERTEVDATNLQLVTVEDLQLEHLSPFIVAYKFNYDELAYFQPFVQHKPPFPDRDIQVLYQTFLI